MGQAHEAELSDAHGVYLYHDIPAQESQLQRLRSDLGQSAVSYGLFQQREILQDSSHEQQMRVHQQLAPVLLAET